MDIDDLNEIASAIPAVALYIAAAIILLFVLFLGLILAVGVSRVISHLLP